MMVGAIQSNSHTSGASSFGASTDSLRDVMQSAANKTGSGALRLGQAATTTTAQAVEAFQRSAADACFNDSRSTNYLINTAQGNGEFKATAERLLDHAMLIYSLGETGSGVDTKDVLKDLQGMVRKFHDAPVALDTLKLNKNEKDYKALKNIGTRLDGLIDASAARPKLLENIQIHLVQSYISAGLRDGIEQRFGMLDAQGVHDVMSHSTASSVAWQALDGALGKAVRNQTHQGFGEFVRGTLAILDLHRPGAEKTPDAAPKAPDQLDSPAAPVDVPKLLELLKSVQGSPIIFAPNMTQTNGSTENSLGGSKSDLSDESVQRVAKEVLKQLAAQSVGNSSNGSNTAVVEKRDAAIQTNIGDVVSQADQERPHAQPANNVLRNNGTYAGPIADALESDSYSGRVDALLDLGTFRIHRPLREASVSNLTSIPESSHVGDNQVEPTQPVLQRNAIPPPPVADDRIEQLGILLNNGGRIARTTAALPTGQEKDLQYYLAQLSSGKVIVNFKNMPSAHVTDFNGYSRGDKTVNANIAMAIQLAPAADAEFKVLKDAIANGASIMEVERTAAGKALFKHYPAMKDRMSKLLERKIRVNDAAPAAGEKRSKIITSVGSSTGVPGSYSATGNYEIRW